MEKIKVIGAGLAGSGGSDGIDVLPVHHERDCFGLNGGRLLEAHFPDGLEDLCGEIHGLKSDRCVDFLRQKRIHSLIMIGADGPGKLVGAGGAAAALDAFEQAGHFFGVAADDQLRDALGIAPAAVVDTAGCDDAVLDLKIDGGGAGSAAFVVKHRC